MDTSVNTVLSTSQSFTQHDLHSDTTSSNTSLFDLYTSVASGEAAPVFQLVVYPTICPKITDFPIDYNPNYKWERASIPQFIVSLMYVGFTKDVLKPYELVIKSWFETEIPKFITKFETLLQYVYGIEYDIIAYNLTTNLPRGITKSHFKYGKMKLGKISIGATIEGLRERFTWMITRETPKFYVVHPEYLPYWQAFISKATNFLGDITEFEKSWVQVIDDAHKIQREAYY